MQLSGSFSFPFTDTPPINIFEYDENTELE